MSDLNSDRARRTDEAIGRVVSGEIDSFEQVILMHEAPLRAWLAGRCPPGVDETELAHQAFVKAYHLLGTYRSGTDFRAWLFTIARNLLLAECKKVRNRTEGTRRYLDLAVTRARERALDFEIVEPDERIVVLQGCLKELPDKSRNIVEQRYTREAGLADIARSVGRSVGAIKKALFLIRRKLEECIGRKIGSEGAGL